MGSNTNRKSADNSFIIYYDNSGLNIEVDRAGNVYLYSVGQWNLDLEQSCRIELSFEVPSGTIRNIFWEQIKDFKLAWAREWNKLFELKVDLSEEKSVRKIVSAKSLGEAELSQINLYNIEINTETDIERELEQEVTTLNSQLNINKSAILLREQALEEKERQLDEIIAEYKSLITELKQLRESYHKTIKDDKTTIKEMTSKMQQEIKRIRKQK